jgi:hypothetical protein
VTDRGGLVTLRVVRVAGSKRRAARILSAVAAALSVVALYVWDDALLSGPVIAMTGLVGPLPSFALFATVYTVASFFLALLGVRAYDRWTTGQPSRFARWLTRQREARRAVWSQRLLDSGKAIGFVVSSFLLGGVVTTFLIRYGGRRDGIEAVALGSSLVFGVMFTAVYTGLAQAAFSL